MLHYTVFHKFVTESGDVILIDSYHSYRIAEGMARAQDETAKYTGIDFDFNQNKKTPKKQTLGPKLSLTR